MSTALLMMNAYVEVTEGARVYYDCPLMGDDYRSSQFFAQHRGKTGVVKGVSTALVGPLDSRGRMPGMYFNPESLDVQFEGEDVVHRGLNVRHFVLLDVAKTGVPRTPLECQKLRDLPKPILYWPGDRVRVYEDVLHSPRIVEDVQIAKDGSISYVLAETADAKRQREEAKQAEIDRRREEAKKRNDPVAGLLLCWVDFPRTECCKADALVLLDRGNVYHLYHDPTKLAFTSPEEEVLFWSTAGISQVVYGVSHGTPRYEWSLDEAMRMVENGEGDLVVAAKQYAHALIPGEGFKVRKLHSCFAQHRERVRACSLSLATPPVEGDVPLHKRLHAMLDD